MGGPSTSAEHDTGRAPGGDEGDAIRAGSIRQPKRKTQGKLGRTRAGACCFGCDAGEAEESEGVGAGSGEGVSGGSGAFL